MKYLAVAAVAAIVLCASAAAAREDVVLMSDSGALGASRAGTLGWERVGATPSTMELDFLFALTNRNVDVLEDTLFKVSDPNSPSFREYLTFDEVRDLTAPTKATVGLVLDFVKRAGATRTELLPSGDALRVHMTAADAARMFNTPRGFHEFHHAGTKQTLHRTVEHYSLPRDVAAVVDFVGGVSRLPRAKMAVHAGLHAVDQAHAPSSGNAPVVFGISGGAVENAFFMPLCADGSPVKLTGGCGLSTVQLSWTVPSGATASTNGSATEFCGPCSQFKGRVLAIDEATACATKDKSLGYAATYCAMQVDDATLGAPAAATVQVQYTDGSLSSPSTQTIIGQPYATPSFLKNMYSVPTTVHKTGPLQAVVEFSDQFYSPKDLAAYQARYNISMTSPVVINGLNDPSNPGLEASLDIQVITAIAENFPTQFWTTSGLRNNSAPPSDGNQEPFQRWLTRLMQFPDGQVPLVNSVSYDDDEYALPVGFTDYLNVQFMKAGSRGLTLLFAAGDDGVGGEGVRDHGPSMCPVFRPAFPATSPYVTAVGGTQVLRVPATAADLTEVVSDSVTGSIITSGGGFSNRFPAPSYQVEAVHGFLTNPSADLPPASYYNASGRGYPDITAFATNYPIIINGSWWQIGGTSASTPLIAGQISLMNQILQAAGAKPMGFINPGIYALGQAPFFTDITVGNNKCSAVPTNCCPYGFKATVGWDSCSGVGSPNFAELVKVLAL